MSLTNCAALMGASILVAGLAGQAGTAGTAATPPQENPVVQPKADEAPGKGPKLGSPDVHQIGSGVQAPTVRRDVKPEYSVEAMAARIQGSVEMDCVVLRDGTVGDVKVTKSLDSGLDSQAVMALRQWEFYPGTLNGDAVPVQVMVEMTFTLRPPR